MTYKKFNEKYCDGTWKVQDDGGVTSKEFDQFSRDFKSVLKEICSMDWEIAKYSNGHYFVSTFLRNAANPEKLLYLSIDDIRYNPNWYKNILYRTAENEKDYRGGMNRHSSLENLQSALERENHVIGEELEESRKNAPNGASISQSKIREAEEERKRIVEPILTSKKSGLYTAFKTFEEKGVFEVNGRKVDIADGKITEMGWKQLEAAMEIYRNKKFETFRYVLIDRKSGEIQNQLAISSHMPNLCMISHPENETVMQVLAQAERLDCLVAVCHNHPSGNTEESSIDRTLTKKLEELLQGRFAGHIILDHGNFNLYTSKNGWNTVKTISETKADPFELEKKPDWANVYIGKSVDLMEVAKKIDGGKSWNDDYVPIVFINTEKQISAIQYYEKDFFKNDHEKVKSELIASALNAGTVAAFPIVPDSLWMKLSHLQREEFAECLRNHVENNAFMDAVINEMTITEKYNLIPGENYYNIFQERLEKNIDIQSSWEQSKYKSENSYNHAVEQNLFPILHGKLQDRIKAEFDETETSYIKHRNKDYESEVSVLNNLITSFAKGKNKNHYLKSVHTFEDDREKMEDFFHTSKDEFLAAYSYLDETEYDATALKVNEKYRLKEPVHADLRLGELFNGIITEEEKYDGSDTVVLSGGNTIERSGTEQEGFFFDMRNKNDSTYLAFDGMRTTKVAEINGISYFTNNDDRMDWQGEVFSLNDDEIKLAFDSKGHGLLSKEAGKSESKTVFLSLDVAKSVIFDDEVVYDKENETLDFYVWATDAFMEQFVPSEKRLGLEDSANEFHFYFIYKDEQNISLYLGYYDKDDKKVYETFKISPESEGFDFLKELMDDYATRSDGKHIKDYKTLDGLETLEYAKLSQLVNASVTPLFSDEMARKIIGYYEQQGIPLYKNDGNELFVYHKNYDDSRREYEESPVEKCRLYDVIKNFIDEYGYNLAADDMLNQFEKVRDSLVAEETNREKAMLNSIKNDLVLTALHRSSEESYNEKEIKFLLTSENVEYALGSDTLSNKTDIEAFYNKYGIDGIKNAVLHDSLSPNEFSDRGILDMGYAPVSLETLMDFINIAGFDSFNTEMAAECAKTFVDNKVPLVCDKIGNIYQRNIGDSRTGSEADLEMLTPSEVIDLYKNDLERQCSLASEEWCAEHKQKIDTLNDIEDYLVKIENSVQLTTENSQILSGYINQNKEEFGKAFTKINGNIPAFEDMSGELAKDIIETLEIGDYYVRFDEKEKQFFIYDQQSADNSLFEKVDVSTLLSKAADIAETWIRDYTTGHENEICKRVEKFLYPAESYLPVKLTVDMNIPWSLQEKWREVENEKDIFKEITYTLLHNLNNNSKVKNMEYIGETKTLTIIIDTSFTVKEPFSYEAMDQNEIENTFLMRCGSVLQERFKVYIANDANGLSEKITFNSIKAEKPAAERTWEEINADWDEQEFAGARNRSKEILEENKNNFTDRELKEETVYQLLYDYIAVDSELSSEELSFNSSVLEEMSKKYVSNELQLEVAQNYFDEKKEEWQMGNHTEKELRFEFADDTNTEKIRICKEALSQCDITKEIRDYLKISLKVEKDIDFDFDDERNYAYYDFDSMHSPTYFVLYNDMAEEKSNPYVAVRFDNKAYELLGRDLPFNKAQLNCVSRIEIESNIENHNGYARGAIVHDVESWKNAQNKQKLNKSTEHKCYEHYVEFWKVNHVFEKGVSEPASFNEFVDNEYRDAKVMKECLSESLFKEYADDIKAFCKNKVEQGNGITLDEVNNLSDMLSLLDKDSIRPSGEQILTGLEEGWKFDEACCGYIESEDQNLPDGVLVIMRIDDMQVFSDDHEASIQAKKDGIKLVPKEEMHFGLDEDGEPDERSYYDYIDTPENRKLLQEAGLLRDKENEYQIGEYVTLDLGKLFEKYVGNKDDITNEKIIVRHSNIILNKEYPNDLFIKMERSDGETYFDLIDSIGTVFAMDGEEVLVAEHKDGMYRLIADEGSEMPHTFYLSESDFGIATGKVNLSQLIDGQNKNNALLEEAKDLISDFCFNEYMATPDFSDLRNVGIAYTDYFDPDTQKEYPIQVSVNLIEPSIMVTFDGKELWKDDNYEDLQDFIATGLNSLDFDSLVSVADYDIIAILKGESSAKLDATAGEEKGNIIELDGKQMNLLEDYLTTKQVEGNQFLESVVYKIEREASHAQRSEEINASVKLTDSELKSLKSFLESESLDLKNDDFKILKEVVSYLENFASEEKTSVATNGNCLGWEDEIEEWLNKNFYRETEYFNGLKTMGKYSYTLSPSIAKPITESEFKLFENKIEPPEEILNRIKDSKFDEAYDTKVAEIISNLQEYMWSTYNARLRYGDILDYLIDDEKLQVLQPSNEEWLLLEPKEAIEKLIKAGIRLDGIQLNEN